MPRYAIFYAPQDGDPLNKAAAEWLGRDVFTGETIERLSPVEGLELAAFDDLTSSARRYGFHGTLKAPFELADGYDLADLEAAVERYCTALSPFDLPPFKIGQLGPFFALLLSESCGTLDDLAANLVRDFDRFRAPLSEADIARRNPDKLSPSQRDNLLNWGYPHIFGNFRFHMTLSDPVSPDRSQAFTEALERHFTPHLLEARRLSSLSIYKEPERGAPFVLHRQYQIG